MNINLELYKIFYYVAKNESITYASKKLHISQPAVSQSIKNLEEQLDTTLFIRNRKGVTLTEQGNILFKKIEPAILLIKDAEYELENVSNNNKGIITIGASNTIIEEYLMKYLIEFKKIYPDIKFRIINSSTSKLVSQANLNLVDIIFTTHDYNYNEEFITYKLDTFHDILAASTKKINEYKNKKINELPLILLDKESTTRKKLEEYCLENDIKLNPEITLSNPELIIKFVLNGFGVGMVTREQVQELLNNNQLYELDIKLPIENKTITMSFVSQNQKRITKLFVDYILNK